MKDNKSTTTQSTGYPDYVTDAQKNVITQAGNLANPLISGDKNMYAGSTPYQQQALQGASGALNKASDPANDLTWAFRNFQPGYDIATYGTQSVDPAQITGAEIQGLMDPYLNSVGRDQLANMRREKTASDAEIGARNASSVAFGGSGPALERAQLERSYQNNVGNAINSLRSQAYNNAAQLTAQNVAARNNVNLANAAAQNAANAGNASIMNNRNQFTSQQAMQALTNADSAANSAASRYNAALQSLLGTANADQQIIQNQLNSPRDALSWYSGFIPGVTGTTTSTSKTPTNPLSTLIGLGSLL